VAVSFIDLQKTLKQRLGNQSIKSRLTLGNRGGGGGITRGGRGQGRLMRSRGQGRFMRGRGQNRGRGGSGERHFQQYFNYIVAVSFIDGGNQSTWRKPMTCRK
jgi:hypothetical protein